MKKRTLTLWLMSSALLLNLSVGTALADEVVETGADNSPKVEATESTPVEQPSDSQEQSLPEDKEAPAATESVTLAESLRRRLQMISQQYLVRNTTLMLLIYLK